MICKLPKNDEFLFFSSFFFCSKISPSYSEALKIFYRDLSSWFFLAATFQPWRWVDNIVPGEESPAPSTGTRYTLTNENKTWISIGFPGLPQSPVSSWAIGKWWFQKGLRSLTSQATLPEGVKSSLECCNLCWQVIHWDKGWRSSIKKMSDQTPNAYKWLLCKQWND